MLQNLADKVENQLLGGLEVPAIFDCLGYGEKHKVHFNPKKSRYVNRWVKIIYIIEASMRFRI